MVETMITNNNGVLQEVTYISNGKEDVPKLEPYNKVKGKKDTVFLYFVVLTGSLTWFVGGSMYSWSSPAIIKLKSNDTSVNPLGKPIRTVEISMLFGIPGMTGLIGSSVMTKLTDIFGRKRVIHLKGLIMFLSIIGAAYTNRIELLILFIAIFGLFFTAVYSVLPMYITEICEDHNRAKFGCILSIFFPLGQLFTYIVGPLFSFRNFTLIIVAPLVLFLASFFFAPESPAFLLANRRKKECITTLNKLRNKSSQELEADIKIIEADLSASKRKKHCGIIRLFSTKEARVGVKLGLLPLIVQYFSGVPILLPLLAPIMNESGSNLSGNAIAVIVGIDKILTYSFTTFLVNRIGKRPLFVASALGCAVSITILGLFFYLNYIQSYLVRQFSWVPLVCILVYITMYSLALGPLPILIIGELFPTELRSTAIAFVTTTVNLLLTCYQLSYPFMAEAIGIHWCMWIFGLTNFLGAFFIYLALPETKGRSILEIQGILRNY